MSRFWKAIGAFAGSAVAWGVTTFAPQTGLELGPDVQAIVMGILPVLGTYFAPKNKD